MFHVKGPNGKFKNRPQHCKMISQYLHTWPGKYQPDGVQCTYRNDMKTVPN